MNEQPKVLIGRSALDGERKGSFNMQRTGNLPDDDRRRLAPPELARIGRSRRPISARADDVLTSCENAAENGGETLMTLIDLVLRASAFVVGRRNLWRLGRVLYAFGRWEIPNSIQQNGERTLIQNALRGVPKPIVFDVGANIGDWARAVLRESKHATIYAFEPTPQCRTKLEALPIEVVACAVSDSIRKAVFTIRGGTAGTNSLISFGERGNLIEVDVTTVEDFAGTRGIDHIDLLKIDAEGFDLSVIRGAASLLRAGRIAIVQFEYNGLWIHSRTFLKDVFDLAADIPYRVGKVIPNGVVIYPHWHYELDRYFEGNYVLVREDMMRQVAASLGTFDRFNTYGASV